MAGDERWYFTKEEINNSPSRRCGIDAEKELSYRQQGAKLIQDMGQRLHVTQLVINTAIVYMHRFYMFHPFTKFHRNSIGPAALFLAAKVEEQPRKLEHVIKIAHYILGHHEHTNLDTQSETYMEKAQELVMNENILLQTLGFDVAIDHPHTHVVKCFQMVHNTTELAQTSYFMATNSLHMTTMCLQYKPAVVACVCIYIVCKWSNYEIQRFTEGRDWFFHVDSTVTLEILEVLTTEFLAVLQKCPSRLKKLMNPGSHGGSSSNNIGDERSRHGSLPMTMNMRPQSIGGSSSSMRTHDISKSVSAKVMSQQAGPSKTVLSHKEYSEKKEKERRERERAEHRAEKHSLPSSLNSSGSFSVPSHHIGSSNAVSAHPPPHTSHLRPQPTPDPAVSRKPHADNNRQPVVHASNRAPVQGAAFKEPLSVKREPAPSSRSSAVYDVKSESTERTSESGGSAKYPVEKSSDHRHPHGGEWPHSRHLEFTKDSKMDVNIKSEFKVETKTGVKEVSRSVENKDIKSEMPSLKVLENTVIPKVEPVLKVKVGKSDLKDDSKPPVAMEDIKHNNRVFFDNSDFSLRDLLIPSAIPPDEIFDDDDDLETKPMLDFVNLIPAETTHHKLKSPPKPTSQGSQHPGMPTPTTLAPSKVANVTSSSGYSAVVKSVDSSHSTNDSKTSSKYSTSSTTVASTHGTHHPTQDKALLGNGLTGGSLLAPVAHQSLSIPSARKKDKSRSPHGPSGKTKHPSAPSDSTLVFKVEEHKSHSAKDPGFPSSQIVSKERPQIPAGDTQQRSAAPMSTPVKVEKVPSGGTSVTLSGAAHLMAPAKPVGVPPEPPKHDTSLSIRLPCTVKSDPPSAAPPAGLVSHLGASQVPVGDPNAVPGVVVSSGSSSSSKKHKRDRVPHKHKEKKKHKHKDKDKDKCKDKDSKEHKEHKSKRYKKHKEKKERRDEKCSGKPTPGPADPVAPSLPLKIILRTKGVYPHEAGTGATAVSRALAADLVPAPAPAPERDPPPPSCEASLGRIKLTIPKSRIQGNPPPVGRAPGISPPRDSSVATTKVKLKLQRPERPDRESRKRDRSPSEGLHFVKIPRTSAAATTTASSAPPQVLDPARWSSQRH